MTLGRYFLSFPLPPYILEWPKCMDETAREDWLLRRFS
jgi:hypothetical protein